MAKKEDNLRPCEYQLSQEEAKKGGIASGEARRRKRDIQAAMQALLEKQYKTNNGMLTGAEAISLKQMEKALKGDPKAFELVRDSAGQKPVEKVMVAEVEQDVIDDVEKAVLTENDEE